MNATVKHACRVRREIYALRARADIAHAAYLDQERFVLALKDRLPPDWQDEHLSLEDLKVVTCRLQEIVNAQNVRLELVRRYSRLKEQLYRFTEYSNRMRIMPPAGGDRPPEIHRPRDSLR
jgi:hypothetical protein